MNLHAQVVLLAANDREEDATGGNDGATETGGHLLSHIICYHAAPCLIICQASKNMPESS